MRGQCAPQRAGLSCCLFAQQLAGAGTGQRLGAELHGAHPLIQRQGAVGGGDVLPHFLLLCFLAVDDGTDLLALFLDDALFHRRALGQQAFQLFRADILAAVQDAVPASERKKAKSCLARWTAGSFGI